MAEKNTFGNMLNPQNKQKIWDWLCSKPSKLTNGGVLVCLLIHMIIAALWGSSVGLWFLLLLLLVVLLK